MRIECKITKFKIRIEWDEMGWDGMEWYGMGWNTVEWNRNYSYAKKDLVPS